MSHGKKNIIGLRMGAKVNIRAGTLAKFKVTGHKICVEMCEENVFEGQMMRVEIGQVVINVALRINDGRDVAVFISNQVGGVR
jgi:hypothetical protein